MDTKRVAILISGRGSNMTALIEAAKSRHYPAEIALVVSNRPDAAGLASRARAQASRPRSSTTRPSARTARPSSARCRRVLEAHRIDLVCLAGFMRLLTPWFVARWSGRMLNIHPALLPPFKGSTPTARARGRARPRHGATVHFVVPEMDSGPIVAQAAVPVLAGDTEETLAARVLEVEHRIYPRSAARAGRRRGYARCADNEKAPGCKPGASGNTSGGRRAASRRP